MSFGKCAAAVVITAFLLVPRTSDAATLGLAWDAASDGVTTGYLVRYGTAPGTYSFSIDVGMVTSNTVVNLSDGTTYYFAVQGYNAAHEPGPLSNEVTSTTLPASPTNLTAGVRSGQLVDLIWQAPSGTVSGYRIEVGTTAGQSNVTTIPTTGTATTFTISTLPAGTYYIRVRSVNGAGVSGPTNEVIVTLVPSSLPPSNLAATVRDAQFIDLTWQAPSGTVSGYRIEVGTAVGQSNVTTIPTTGTATTFTISTLPAGTYYLRVRAVNSTGVSAPSNEVVATLVAAPSPPSGLSATVRDGLHIDLTWQAPTGTVSGYRIEVGTAAGQSNVTTIPTTGTATTYTISSLAAGVYYLRVRAVNSTGVSAPSNEVVATLVASALPPSNLAATVRAGQFIDLTWQAPSGTVSGYRIEVGSAAGQSNVTTLTTTGTTFTIDYLRGGPYYIRVRSVNGSDVSAPSNEVVVLCAPSAPANLAATVRKKRYVDLTWQAPSTGAASYRVEVGTARGLSDVRIVTTTATQVTLEGLPAGVHYIRVRGVNAAGVGAPSNEVKRRFSGGGGLTPPENLSATLREGSSIDLTWDIDDEALFYRVEVGSASGTTDVSSFTTGATSSFTIGELPANTYFIRVRSANDDGFSDPSNDVVVTGVGGRDAPRRLLAAIGADNAVRLMWDAPLGSQTVTGYLIEAGTGPGRSDIGTVPTNDHSFTSAPVANGTYFLRVRAVTATGAGSASNEVVVHIGAEPRCSAPPAAPWFVAHVAGSFVELSWSPGAGDSPTGYILDVGSAPGRRDIATMPLGVDVTTLTTQVANGTYALRLTAVNACGASAWASDTSVTLGGPDVALPGAPSGLTQQVVGRSVTLTWSPPTSGDATSYVIELLTTEGQLLLSIDTGNVSTTFTHDNAPVGQYMLRVRAANVRGPGAMSNAVGVQIP